METSEKHLGFEFGGVGDPNDYVSFSDIIGFGAPDWQALALESSPP